jgi:hypothetical protein
MAQTSLNSTGVASSGALSLQSNGTTEAIGISTGQVATLAQNPILTSGTANGVAYLNGSKVLTTGSALVFDGTNLGVGVTPSAWGSGYKAIDISGNGSFYGTSATAAQVWNAYNNGTNWIYKATNSSALYLVGAGTHTWYSAAGGTAGNAISFTQAMTLDASGNLGVGRTSPAGVFSGSGGIDAAGMLVVRGAIATNLTDAGVLQYNSNTVALRAYGNTAGSGIITFNTGGGGGSADTERARITSGGLLQVGTTTFNNGLINTVTASGLWGISIRDNAANAAMIQFVNSAGAQAGSITISGTTTNYGSGSDYRLKDEVAPMTGALEKVQALKPVTWKWKADGADGEGFIAHELAEVCPQAVTGEKDAVNEDGSIKPQGVDTSFLVATLTAAIQELKAEFDAYKATHP